MTNNRCSEKSNSAQNKIDTRGLGKRAKCLKTMAHRIMLKVGYLDFHGDIVHQMNCLAGKVRDLRSPSDSRWHDKIVLSKVTAHKRRQCWHNAAIIWKRQFPKMKLYEIRREHVWILIESWKRQGTPGYHGSSMGAGAIVNKLVYLRALTAFLRLDGYDIVPTNAEVLQFMEQGRRLFIDGKDRSLEAHGLNFSDVFVDAWSIDRNVAIILLLCWIFGMRVEEAMKWRPHCDFFDAGRLCLIKVVRGPKNGKQRDFVLDYTKDIRLAVALTTRFVNTHTHCLIPDEFEFEGDFRNHFNNVVKKIKLTRKGLGTTPHGLRYSFAKRYYDQELARLHGGPVPATAVKPELDFVARSKVSKTLGHSRISISAVYCGPPATPLR